jgi:hypothetical protein
MQALGALLAAVAVLVGAGSALADDGGKGDQAKAFRDAVAAKLGVTPEQLQAAFAAAATERIDAAVAAGTLTPEKAAKLKQAIADGKLRFHKGFHKRKGIAKRTAWFSASAAYLGLEKDALKAELKQGKSLAQIAQAQGKTADDLVNVLLAKFSDRFDQAVEKKRLSAERKQELLDKTKAWLEKLVDKQFTATTK